MEVIRTASTTQNSEPKQITLLKGLHRLVEALGILEQVICRQLLSLLEIALILLLGFQCKLNYG